MTEQGGIFAPGSICILMSEDQVVYREHDTPNGRVVECSVCGQQFPVTEPLATHLVFLEDFQTGRAVPQMEEAATFCLRHWEKEHGEKEPQ